VGDVARVTDGAFESFEGTVQLIDEERGKITISIEIFGRATPVVVEFWQVKRI
jgi:transcriptional antiterminator NusG